MDCEKFESTLMDELYDELDELTSAASKRHVASCARCASLLHGLSATRRIAVLERVEPPAGLEARILAATKEAQKVVPLRGRISRVVSWAGSWAMRPQTAMAAVFLLMIGSTSILLLRARSSLQGMGGSAMVVTEQGAPAASAAADEQENSIDPDRAAGAHGAIEGRKAAGPATGTAPAAPPASDGLVANKDEEDKPGDVRRERAMEKKEVALGSAASVMPTPAGGGGSDAFQEGSKMDPPAAAPTATMPAPAAKGYASPARPVTKADTGGDEKGSGDSGYDAAMSLYRARNYDEATRAFDALAAGGNVNASLMAARSVRDASGCTPAAIQRFDQVSARAYGTPAGYDATLEGGRCCKGLGQLDAARTHFARLLTVPSHAARAQAELDAIGRGPAVGRSSAPPAKKAAPKAIQSSPKE